MKYTIEYGEVIKRINSVTIEVADEEAGEAIADRLFDDARCFNHPEDILSWFHNRNINITDVEEGAEIAEYEIY